MKFLALCLVMFMAIATAFQPKTMVSISKSLRQTSSLLAFGGGKKAKKDARIALAEEKGYWQGEWICADCGYIYDPELFGGIFFEQQTKGFKCPQCSGPRRRYAKKVGDTVGVTLDGGDGPILLASFLGIAATMALGFYFTFN